MRWFRLIRTGRPAKRRDYASVLRALASGELRETPDGVLHLPEGLWSADVGHTVFVARKGEEIAAVVFRRWIGKGGNFRGHIFLPVDNVLDLVRPDYHGRPMARVGPIEAVLGRRYDTNWCLAFFDLD